MLLNPAKKKKVSKIKNFLKERKALTRVRMGGVGCVVGSYQSLADSLRGKGKGEHSG